jgi:hypothetical protein
VNHVGERMSVRPEHTVMGVDDDVIVAEDADAAEHGTREPKKINEPRKPNAEEILSHNLTHLPYRNWCPICVKGRGKEMPHRRSDGPGEIPEIHFDFCFLGDENDPGNTVPILCARSRGCKMTLASAVPSKSTGTFVAKRILAFLREIGCEHGDVIFKSDNEPAIVAILDDVAALRAASSAGRVIRENSVVGDSKTNGVAERAIQSVEGMVRVLKAAVETRWGVTLPSKHAVLPWIIEYSAFLLNRFEVSADGFTAYERCKGKKAKVLGVEFGESILWRKRPMRGALGKLSSLWGDGIYLGVKGGTGEIIVANSEGVWKCRTIQRRPAEDRWPSSAADMVIGVPWRTSDHDDRVDGEAPVAVRFRDEELPRLEPDLHADPLPRRAKIFRRDLEKHGFSAKCPGCISILKGTTQQGHSEACRKRLQAELSGEERFRRAEERTDDFLSKVLELEDRKRAKVAHGPGPARRDEQHPQDPDEPSGEQHLRDPSERPQEQHFRDHDVPASSNSAAASSSRERRQREERDEDEQDDELEEPAKRRARIEQLEVNEELDTGEESYEPTFDERSGEELPWELVEAAAREEVAYMKKLGLYDIVPIEECIANTGKMPISTKWVRVNKGTAEQPDVRCRLVARDFKPRGEKDRADLFASTPPLEAKKLLFREAVRWQGRQARRGQEKVALCFVDVKKAHLNGILKQGELAYVELPEQYAVPGMCGRLNRWLYGMRQAASAWEDDYVAKFRDAGFAQGKASPTVFFNPKTKTRCVVHGDDFTFLGLISQVDDIISKMASWYEIKVRGKMTGFQDSAETMTILNRHISWKNGEFTYEADPRHAQEICEHLQLEPWSKGLDVAAAREEDADQDDDRELEPDEAREFRSIAARANYLAMDRLDIQFASKEICRDMSAPTSKSQRKLKRLGRFLLKHPRLVITYADSGGNEELEIQAFSDSNWAGCLTTRRSTSGGVLCVNGACVKSWSSTQASVSLSVGEAELYAATKAAAEAIGLRSLAHDLGWSARVEVLTDSATAKSIASRTGIGKVRHLAVRHLWLQGLVKSKDVVIVKVPGSQNPADVLTKPIQVDLANKVVGEFGIHTAAAHKLSWADMSGF